MTTGSVPQVCDDCRLVQASAEAPKHIQDPQTSRWGTPATTSTTDWALNSTIAHLELERDTLANENENLNRDLVMVETFGIELLAEIDSNEVAADRYQRQLLAKLSEETRESEKLRRELRELRERFLGVLQAYEEGGDVAAAAFPSSCPAVAVIRPRANARGPARYRAVAAVPVPVPFASSGHPLIP